MSDEIDAFHFKGSDGIIRTLSEHYDSMRDVENDPYGAWLAIQNQAARITALEGEMKKALNRLEASAFTNAEHRQAADILRAAIMEDKSDE